VAKVSLLAKLHYVRLMLCKCNECVIVMQEFSKLCGDKEQLIMLLDRINSPFIRANATVLQALMRLIPFLAFGDQEKMHALVSHFMPYLDFDKYVFVTRYRMGCLGIKFCTIALATEKH